MRPIEDDMQQEIEDLRYAFDMLRRNGRDMPVLTLREYYAGLAMQALINNVDHSHLSWNGVASNAIRYADALIAELSSSPGNAAGSHRRCRGGSPGSSGSPERGGAAGDV